MNSKRKRVYATWTIFFFRDEMVAPWRFFLPPFAWHLSVIFLSQLTFLLSHNSHVWDFNLKFDLQYEWDDLRSIMDDIQMNIKKLNNTYYEICTSKTLFFLHRVRYLQFFHEQGWSIRPVRWFEGLVRENKMRPFFYKK